MTNNDVLRRMRYIFDLSDAQMIATYGLAELTASRTEISEWLKKEEDEDYVACIDTNLAAFLNGFIIEKRGKKDDKPVVNEDTINNNVIFNKIKIALSLQSDAIIDLIASADFAMSKHELSALFRKPTHKNFRVCNDQILRKFLQGLQLRHRPTGPAFSWDDSPATEPDEDADDDTDTAE